MQALLQELLEAINHASPGNMPPPPKKLDSNKMFWSKLRFSEKAVSYGPLNNMMNVSTAQWSRFLSFFLMVDNGSYHHKVTITKSSQCFFLFYRLYSLILPHTPALRNHLAAAPCLLLHSNDLCLFGRRIAH